MSVDDKSFEAAWRGPDQTDDEDIKEHLMQVGLVCIQWSHLEWLLELMHWWLLGLLNAPTEGRLITSGPSIDAMARRVSGLSHLKISNEADRAQLATIEARIKAVVDERNLAVHGTRSEHPEVGVTASVARGKYKNEPQKLPLVRLRSLNTEIGAIISALEPLLVRYGIIENQTTALQDPMRRLGGDAPRVVL